MQVHCRLYMPHQSCKRIRVRTPWVFQRNILVSPFSMWPGNHVDGGLVDIKINSVCRCKFRAGPRTASHIIIYLCICVFFHCWLWQIKRVKWVHVGTSVGKLIYKAAVFAFSLQISNRSYWLHLGAGFNQCGIEDLALPPLPPSAVLYCRRSVVGWLDGPQNSPQVVSFL